LLPLLIGRQQRGVLWWYLLTGLLADICISFYLKPHNYNRLWLSNLHFLLEFVFLSVYISYKIRWLRNRAFLLFVFLLIGLFLLTTVRDSIFILNSTGITMFHLAFIGYSIAGLYYLLKEQETLLISDSSFFWTCVAMLLYFSGNILLFVFLLLNPEYKQPVAYLWGYIHCSLNILYHILLAVSLSKKQ
jgi:hypothetical protein